MSTNIPDNPFFNQSEVFPQQPEDFIRELTRVYQSIANKGNLREIADYRFNEIPTGQLSPGTNTQCPRNGFRKIFDFTGLALGLNTTAHGITLSPNAAATDTTVRFTNMYGVVFSTALPTPEYHTTPNDDIHLDVTGTLLRITIPAAYVGFDARIILEYTKTD